MVDGKNGEINELSDQWASDSSACNIDIFEIDNNIDSNLDDPEQEKLTEIFRKRFFDAYDKECRDRSTCELKLDKIIDSNGEQDLRSAFSRRSSPQCRTLSPQESAYVLKADCV